MRLLLWTHVLPLSLSLLVLPPTQRETLESGARSSLLLVTPAATLYPLCTSHSRQQQQSSRRTKRGAKLDSRRTETAASELVVLFLSLPFLPPLSLTPRLIRFRLRFVHFLVSFSLSPSESRVSPPTPQPPPPLLPASSLSPLTQLQFFVLFSLLRSFSFSLSLVPPPVVSVQRRCACRDALFLSHSPSLAASVITLSFPRSPTRKSQRLHFAAQNGTSRWGFAQSTREQRSWRKKGKADRESNTHSHTKGG